MTDLTVLGEIEALKKRLSVVESFLPHPCPVCDDHMLRMTKRFKDGTEEIWYQCGSLRCNAQLVKAEAAE